MLKSMAKEWQMKVTAVALPGANQNFDIIIHSDFDQALFDLIESWLEGRLIPRIILRVDPSAEKSQSPNLISLGLNPSPADLSRALADSLTGRMGDTTICPEAPRLRDISKLYPLKIVAADDTWTNREAITLICRHLGYEIDLVENGLELIERVRSKTYDLALVDVQMPQLDGISATLEMIRLYPDPKSRPRIVALTANVQPGDRERCIEAGMDDYLAKPVMPRDLTEMIERLFGVGAKADLGTPKRVHHITGLLIDYTHFAVLCDGMEWHENVAFISKIYKAATSDLASLHPRIRAQWGNRDRSAH